MAPRQSGTRAKKPVSRFRLFAKAARKAGLIVTKASYDRYFQDMPDKWLDEPLVKPARRGSTPVSQETGARALPTRAAKS